MNMESFMRAEMKKPAGERNIMPMISYCEVCGIGDCSQPRCPLTQAKYHDRYIPYEEFAASQGKEPSTEIKTMSVQDVKPTIEDHQWSLF